MELEKIRALESHFQTKLNATYSIFISFVVGYILFLGSLYYQGVFKVFDEANFNFLARIGNILVFTVFPFFPLYYIKRKRLDPIDDLSDRCLVFVEELLNKVEKGEALPPLRELKEMNKQKHKTKEKIEADNMQPKGKAYEFFMGIMIAIVGNFLVSTLIETSNSVFNNEHTYIISYWALMFILSSTLTFQFTRFALKSYIPQKSFRNPFNLATVILICVGIVPILYAVFR